MNAAPIPVASVDANNQSNHKPAPEPPVWQPKSKHKGAKKAKKAAPVANSGSKPNKYLPTDRITFPRQLDLLRGWAAASGPTAKVVSNNDVGPIVKMTGSTVSINNAFLGQNGFLAKADGGYIPTPDVFSFLRAYEWSPDTAATKLAPIVSRTWFAEELLPKLTFGPLTTAEAIQHLADVCNAGPDYRGQLRFLLEYMNASGLIEWDGNQVRKGSSTVTTSTAPNTDIVQTPSNPPPLASEPSKRTGPTFFGTTEGAVNFNVSVRVDMGEFANWKPERIAAFFNGMAQVLAAKADVEKVNEPQK
jgi:hypothetical protein